MPSLSKSCTRSPKRRGSICPPASTGPSWSRRSSRCSRRTPRIGAPPGRGRAHRREEILRASHRRLRSGRSGPTSPCATRYNETMIRAIARDPSWAFAYWDVSDSDIEALRGEDSTAGLFLRVAEIGPLGEQATRQRGVLRHPRGRQRSPVVHQPSALRRALSHRPLRATRAAKAGKFRVLARSNEVESPRQELAARPRASTPRATSFSPFPASAISPSTTSRTAIRLRILPSGSGEAGESRRLRDRG